MLGYEDSNYLHAILINSFFDAERNYNKLQDGAAEIECMTKGIYVSLPRPFEVAQSVYDIWLNGLLDDFSIEYQGDSDARITPGILPTSVVMDFDTLWRQARSDTHNSFAYYREKIENYDIDELYSSIKTIGTGLERSGFEKTARTLVEVFGLSNARYTSIERKKRFWHFPLPLHLDYSFSVYSSHAVDKLKPFTSLFKTVENESGIVGLTSALNRIIHEFNIMDSKPEPRQVIGKGLPLEAVCFKGHLDMRLSLEAGDMVLAFIKEYFEGELYF